MAVFVTQVSPKRLLTGQTNEITVSGAGFMAPVTVVINKVPIPAFFVTDRLVKFLLPYIPAGTYDISVGNGDGCRWTCRQAFTITDPPAGQMADLGSAARPIVLPPRQIGSQGNAMVSPATKYRAVDSPAKISYDPKTGVVTGELKTDMSYLPTEPVRLPEKDSNPEVLETPWGTFKNE